MKRSNDKEKLSDNEIKSIVMDCVKRLQENEGSIANDISEIAITHKLADYLQDRFSTYSVDVGYNRNSEKGIQIPKYYQPDKYGIPDIVVHERLNHNHNLLVIEIKKLDNGDLVGRENDHKKLEAFTRSLEMEGYGYQLGLFLEIPQKYWNKVGYTYFKKRLRRIMK